MDIHQALLQAILDSPADDLPRLAYADWLEEHGSKVGRERAEFIRLQLQLADPPSPGRAAKRQRARELLARRGFTWLGPLRKVVPGRSAEFFRWDFGRGFVEKLTFPATIAPDHLVALIRDAFRVAPLLRLRAVPYYHWSEWVDPAGGLMRHEGVVALASCPELVALRSLELNDCGIVRQEFQALIDSPHLRNLTWLDLRRTPQFCFLWDEQTEKALRQRFGDALQVGHVGEEYLNVGDAYSRTFWREDHSSFRVLYGDSAGVGPPQPLPGRKRGKS